ncbi:MULTISPECIES: NtaA/DmoA family FMN-dependent monooxygenase [Rhodococcus]|uniref:NtaA/DmoA family FMN-dependent monooxygenase n=1 Tax=Rhodococcus TaxID=1827 RepID=UPI00193C714D|nr:MULTISPECIES: NtaA/DmoA family FMN-dependent monooxygenase [Rhodococcus]QRI78039.1 NtaA/DmoA family FMN-dependent monooxygenase [Rhodococcus aetherivorans]QSE61454.1 NtaA/DmoA family FMN-dependent monooxygenase [Rhodococcus sp. PSBB066]QSE67236.1 NtaA/DmoA family FMN-dependent monooxygenase [Rhodococcus sp. PSBB049]
MGNRRDGHVILGVNVLVYGYIPSAWRSPLLGARDFLEPAYWERIGRLAERATLDAVFLADALGLGDPAYDANPIRLDPTVLWAHVAQATERVGLIATASTTFNDPVELASRILTLDHVSRGRAGWNLVTTRDDRSAANFGLSRVVPRSERYDRGAEFAELVQRLWSAAGTGETVRYDGRYFGYDGDFVAPASPQGRPVLFQAGGSPGGRDIASRFADGVFAAEITQETAREHYRQVKADAVRHGRAPGGVKILPGLLLTLGSTEEEARRRVDELYETSPGWYSAAWLSHAIGVDVAKLELDEKFPDDVLRGPVDTDLFQGSIGFRESILEQIRQTQPTVREYLRETRYTGSGHGGFVGTPEQLVDRIEEWYLGGACDGFNLQPDILTDGLEVIADEVVPRLRSRGLYRTEYETETLRGHFEAAEPAHGAALHAAI